MIVLAALLLLGVPPDADATTRQASFHVRKSFTLKVPKGAQRVRFWFAKAFVEVDGKQSSDWSAS
ncbi:MAG: hypothetical protein ACXWLR_04205 [Myxococcales bacterium]